VIGCKKQPMPGACLTHLYRQKTGTDLVKTRLTDILVERMLSSDQRRKIDNRPIIRTLARVARLAELNPFPIMQQTWERNQASKHLGKKR
jgi:hypothetical protein